LTAALEPRIDEPAARLLVRGIRNPRSLGISRYAALLGNALAREHVDYLLARRGRGFEGHFHLANSSRALLLDAPTSGTRFMVTVHDVVPRTRALRPLYRKRVYPQLVRHAAAVIVHSAFAADMLAREAGGPPARLEVIPHPARRPGSTDRLAARRALGWSDESLIVLLPGIIKPAKLVQESIAAVSSVRGWRLALSGKVADRRAVRAAHEHGALVLPDPDDQDYERAIVAADCVLCLRAGSVGETNGPLLDALGSGRAVLATATGSIPEVGGEALHYCDGTARGIRGALVDLADANARAHLERAATRRAVDLTWEASAALHAALFREVFDG
jgi:glycosyltransferase involved in cell wall biosynthesis